MDKVDPRVGYNNVRKAEARAALPDYFEFLFAPAPRATRG